MPAIRAALPILPIAILLAAICAAGGTQSPTTAAEVSTGTGDEDQHMTPGNEHEREHAHDESDEHAADADSSGADHEPVSWVRDLPDTTEYVRLLGAPDSLALHSGLVTLQPGEDCGWHSTENYEEMIIVLEGAGHLESEGIGRRPLRAGQYGYNGPHTRHCVFNTSDRLMRYIYIVARVAEDEEHHEDDDHRGDDHHDESP
jgi:quercetin dioxygenase-like cupin family protein